MWFGKMFFLPLFVAVVLAMVVLVVLSLLEVDVVSWVIVEVANEGAEDIIIFLSKQTK